MCKKKKGKERRKSSKLWSESHSAKLYGIKLKNNNLQDSNLNDTDYKFKSGDVG
jgi:hypothetical protein